MRGHLRFELKEIFACLKKTGVLVTHSVTEATLLSDEGALMSDGMIIQSGPINDLIENPASSFVREFFELQRQGV